MMQITNQDVRASSSTRKHEIGSLAQTPDGRKYRYASIGSTATVAGKVYVKPALVAAHQNRAANDTDSGAKEVVIASIGATALTADQYAGGYLVVRDGTGAGRSFRINGHIAYDASATNVKIQLDEALDVALANSDTKVDLCYSKQSKVILATASVAHALSGVPNIDVAADGFGWVQTGGHCAVLFQGTPVIGTSLALSGTTAGAVTTASTDTAALTATIIGETIETGVNAKNLIAYLTLD